MSRPYVNITRSASIAPKKYSRFAGFFEASEASTNRTDVGAAMETRRDNQCTVPTACPKIEDLTRLKRDFDILRLSTFASARKLQPFRFPPTSPVKPVLARTLSIMLGFTFLGAGGASDETQTPTRAHVQVRGCKIARVSLSAPSLLLPSNLAAYSFTDSAPCTNDLFSPLFSAQSSANPSKGTTNSGGSNANTKVPDSEHRFWDRKNSFLFAAVGASRALDYSSTLNFRRRGRDEAFLTNDIVDNHAAFAAIEAAGTAVSIGVSYLFHRYHHHRLERWTSIVHASLATSGAVRNYCLKTEYPLTVR